MASSLTVDLGGAADDVGPSPRAARPRKRKLRERISLGHLFMIAAALLAFVLVVSVLQDRTETRPVLVAARDILPGTAITPDLVTEIDLPAGSPLIGTVATLDDIAGGRLRAGQRIVAGDPLTLTAVAPSSTPSALRAMSLPIDRVDAVGGDLAAGDRVDVISVDGGAATYVATDLEVLGTQSSEARSGALSSSALSTYFVTVALDDQTALAVALALTDAEVSIVRATGAEPVAPADRTLVRSGPGQPAGGTTGSDDQPGSGDGG